MEYEATRIPVSIDGKMRIYIPDFTTSGGAHYEIKGYRRIDGLVKVHQAVADGHDVSLVRQPELEMWCGCTISRMYRAHSSGGIPAVEMLIKSAIG